MNTFPTKFFRLIVSFIVLILHLSCSTDTDLLADVILPDSSNALLEIKVIASKNEPVIIEVIAEGDTGEVIEVSEPDNGTANINPDNTITYTPDTDAEGTDEFEFTVDTPSNNGIVSTTTGTVKVTIDSEVAFWKNKFDTYWKNSNYDFSKTSSHSRSAFNAASSSNFEQEYYFLAYYIDGLIQIWQATGENSYLDDALELIHITINKAVKVKGDFLGWPGNINADGVALWDSYYWRYVATLTRIMHQSPTLRTLPNTKGGTYQDDYEKLLSFGEVNIWDRYESYGLNNFYRSNTHMASHWARIGMEFFIITGKQKYKEVFDNISFGNMVDRPSNLRQQLYSNPKNPSSVLWSQIWGASQGVWMQDTSHGGAVVSFIINAHSNKMYWTQEDIDALIVTLDKVLWKDSDKAEVSINIDGSGGYHNPGGRLHEWLTLGRYSAPLQNKIKNNYIGKNFNYYGTHFFGIAALNAKILKDGKPVYPEIH